MRTSQKRVTGVRRNSKLVSVRRTIRCKHLGRCELVAATEENSHNSYCRFTIEIINHFKNILSKLGPFAISYKLFHTCRL